MNVYHFIWFLLPLFYLAIILKAYAKRAAKSHLLEDERHYLKQFLYCLICFFIAVGIDNALDPNFFNETFLGDLGDTDVFYWLIYPAVLLLGASFVKFIPGAKDKQPPAPPRARF